MAQTTMRHPLTLSQELTPTPETWCVSLPIPLKCKGSSQPPRHIWAPPPTQGPRACNSRRAEWPSHSPSQPSRVPLPDAHATHSHGDGAESRPPTPAHTHAQVRHQYRYPACLPRRRSRARLALCTRLSPIRARARAHTHTHTHTHTLALPPQPLPGARGRGSVSGLSASLSPQSPAAFRAGVLLGCY